MVFDEGDEGVGGWSSDLMKTTPKLQGGPLTSIRRQQSHQEGSSKVTPKLQRGLPN
jgi:hypothetical protein